MLPPATRRAYRGSRGSAQQRSLWHVKFAAQHANCVCGALRCSAHTHTRTNSLTHSLPLTHSLSRAHSVIHSEAGGPQIVRVLFRVRGNFTCATAVCEREASRQDKTGAFRGRGGMVAVGGGGGGQRALAGQAGFQSACRTACLPVCQPTRGFGRVRGTQLLRVWTRQSKVLRLARPTIFGNRAEHQKNTQNKTTKKIN